MALINQKYIAEKNSDDSLFINLHDGDSYGCRYNVYAGSRTAGKTYQYKIRTLENMLIGKQTAYIRRYEEDIRPAMIQTLWDDITFDGTLKRYAQKFRAGYDDYYVGFKGGTFTLYGRTDDSDAVRLCVLGRVCSMNKWERYKSNNFALVDDIFFDEFLTSERELDNEFKIALNMISTIARQRDVRIYFFGNTVSRNSQIMQGMGINLRNIKNGITVFEYKEIDPATKNYIYNSVCVNFYGAKGQNENTKSMFTFTNGKTARMIVDGQWEHEEYPKLSIDDVKNRKTLSDFAVRICKNDLTLYIYDLDDFLYVSDIRIKPKNGKIEYITIWDGVTDDARACYNFNCQLPAIIAYCDKLAIAESLGLLRFNSDLTGEDFSRQILKTTAVKEQ